MSDTENTQDARKKKAIWRAEHRGIREMDLLMGSFARQHVPDMDDDSLADFEALITVADPDLYNWLLGREDVPGEFRTPVFERLRQHRPEIN